MTGRYLIPYRIRIGVTGHRTLADTSALTSCVEEIVASRYREAFTPEARRALEQASGTPVVFTIISPLSEGADRLVAKAILNKGGVLEALLPMPREEYEEDFASPESRREFADLLGKAHRIKVTASGISPADDDYRRKAYQRVGEETVERCDILIALWDDHPSRGLGGTADVVAFALKRNKPVFILSTLKPGEVKLKHAGIIEKVFISEIDKYNCADIDDDKLDACINKVYEEIFPPPLAEQLPDFYKQIVRSHIIPHYCRASMIAENNQRRYKRTGLFGYLLSALSVLSMAVAVVSESILRISIAGFFCECLFLVFIYYIIHKADKIEVQRGWLVHRALAERLRTASYFAACGEPPLDDAGGSGPTYHIDRTWLHFALDEILYGLPEAARPESPQLEVYRKFIDAGWVQGQIDYHDKNAEKLYKRNLTLKIGAKWLFWLAIAVSFVHILFKIAEASGYHPEYPMLLVDVLLKIIAITIPAAVAAFVGYRFLLEQSRIAARSKTISFHLKNLKRQSIAQDPDSFRQYLERIGKTMLRESDEWLAFMEHSELDQIT